MAICACFALMRSRLALASALRGVPATAGEEAEEEDDEEEDFADEERAGPRVWLLVALAMALACAGGDEADDDAAGDAATSDGDPMVDAGVAPGAAIARLNVAGEAASELGRMCSDTVPTPRPPAPRASGCTGGGCGSLMLESATETMVT